MNWTNLFIYGGMFLFGATVWYFIVFYVLDKFID